MRRYIISFERGGVVVRVVVVRVVVLIRFSLTDNHLPQSRRVELIKPLLERLQVGPGYSYIVEVLPTRFTMRHQKVNVPHFTVDGER